MEIITKNIQFAFWQAFPYPQSKTSVSQAANEREIIIYSIPAPDFVAAFAPYGPSLIHKLAKQRRKVGRSSIDKLISLKVAFL